MSERSTAKAEHDTSGTHLEGLQLPVPDNLSDEIADPVEREQLRQREIEFARHQVDQAEQRTAAEERRQPSELNDPNFDSELANNERVADQKGQHYSVFRLHPEVATEGQKHPLVVILGLISTAQAGNGRDVAHEFYTHINDRELIVIDNEGAGESDPVSEGQDITAMAQSRVDVLNALGIEDFDVAGYSLGGALALEVAAQVGDRAGSVTTIQAEGFEDLSPRDQRRLLSKDGLRNDKALYRQKVDQGIVSPAVVDRVKEAKSLGEKPKGPGLLGRLRSIRRHVQVTLEGSPSTSAVDRLDPGTKWNDVVGSKDSLTDWRTHLETVRNRNAARGAGDNAHNSELLVVAGGEHFSVKAERAVMAETVATALKRADK